MCARPNRNHRLFRRTALLTLGTVLGLAFSASAQTLVGTAFTYQGRLTDGGGAANGSYDLQFKLFDAAAGGSQVGATVTLADQAVTDGLFTVELDFGNTAFQGAARWLQVEVRPGADIGAYTVLSPRQELTPAPYAIGLSLPYTGVVTSTSNAVSLTNSGTGRAALFKCDNATSANATLRAETAGTFAALYGVSTGLGRAGLFEINNASNHGVALEATTNATSGASPDGIAIRGRATSASGDETYGVWGESAGANGIGVYGKASSTSTTGVMFGGFFESAGDLGVAVHAVQTATTSGPNRPNFGVWGSCTSALSGEGSAGVRGTNYGKDPIPPDEFPPVRYGVWGEARGYGYGVYGTSIDSAGTGVRGEAPATGVSGYATANSGITSGVFGQCDSSTGHAGSFRANTAGGVALYALNNVNSGPIIEGWNNGDREFYVDSSGDVFCDGAFTGGGADFAERLPAEPSAGRLEPGDVLVFSDEPGAVRLSSKPNDPQVVGVYSTKPGFLGGGVNDDDQDGDAKNPETLRRNRENDLPVALVGIVPVKISNEAGAIRVGDLLTTGSVPGHAMKARPIGQLGGRPVYEQGTILGKAMENWDGATGKIKMLVLPR